MLASASYELAVGKALVSRSAGAKCPTRLLYFRAVMYILYLDGSGSVKNPGERHFILAVVAVFERQIYHLISKADQFVAALGLGHAADIELHASPMANGKRWPWKGLERRIRLETIERGLSLLHGLVHRKSAAEDCYCPACMSRSLRAVHAG